MRALSLDPDLHKSYIYLGRANLELGFVDRAEDIHKLCLGLCKKGDMRESVLVLGADIAKMRDASRMSKTPSGVNGLDQQIYHQIKSSEEESGEPVLQYKRHLCEGVASYHKRKYLVSIECFEQALDLAKRHGMEALQTEEDELTVVKYILAKAYLATQKEQNVLTAIDKLREITTSPTTQFPAALYGLACAYKLLNRYQDALKPVQQGLAMVKAAQSHNKKVVHLWPQTDQTIEETSLSKLSKLLEELEKECIEPPKPVGVCRLHSDTENPNREIYTSDPAYKGHVVMQCSQKCSIAFHHVCWKVYKTQMGGDQKHSDKDLLDTACPTPSCTGQVIIIEKKGTSKPVSLKSTQDHVQPKQAAPQQPKIRTDNPEKLRKKEERKRAKRQKKAEVREKLAALENPEPISAKDEPQDIMKVLEKPNPLLNSNVKLVELKKEEEETAEVKQKASKGKKKKEKTKTILPVEIQYKGDEEKRLVGAHSLDDDGDYFSQTGGVHMGPPPTMPGMPIQDMAYRTGLLPFPTGDGLLSYQPMAMDKVTSALYQFFRDLLTQSGPVDLESSQIKSYISSFPSEFRHKIAQYGGEANFLRVMEAEFCVIESRVVCLHKDRLEGNQLFNQLQRSESDTRLSPPLAPAKTFSWEQRGKDLEAAKRQAEDLARETPSPPVNTSSRLNPSAKEFSPCTVADSAAAFSKSDVLFSAPTYKAKQEEEDFYLATGEAQARKTSSRYDTLDSIDLYTHPTGKRSSFETLDTDDEEEEEEESSSDEGFVTVGKKNRKNRPDVKPSATNTFLSQEKTSTRPLNSNSMYNLDTIRLDDKLLCPKWMREGNDSDESETSDGGLNERRWVFHTDVTEASEGLSLNGADYFTPQASIRSEKLDHMSQSLRKHHSDLEASTNGQGLNSDLSHYKSLGSSRDKSTPHPSTNPSGPQPSNNHPPPFPNSFPPRPSRNHSPATQDQMSEVSDLSSEGQHRSSSPSSSTHSTGFGSQGVSSVPKPLSAPGVNLPSRGRKKQKSSSSRLSTRSSGLTNTSSEGSLSQNGQEEDRDSLPSSSSGSQQLRMTSLTGWANERPIASHSVQQREGSDSNQSSEMSNLKQNGKRNFVTLGNVPEKPTSHDVSSQFRLYRPDRDLSATLCGSSSVSQSVAPSLGQPLFAGEPEEDVDYTSYQNPYQKSSASLFPSSSSLFMNSNPVKPTQPAKTAKEISNMDPLSYEEASSTKQTFSSTFGETSDPFKREGKAFNFPFARHRDPSTTNPMSEDMGVHQQSGSIDDGHHSASLSSWSVMPGEVLGQYHTSSASFHKSTHTAPVNSNSMFPLSPSKTYNSADDANFVLMQERYKAFSATGDEGFSLGGGLPKHDKNISQLWTSQKDPSPVNPPYTYDKPFPPHHQHFGNKKNSKLEDIFSPLSSDKSMNSTSLDSKRPTQDPSYPGAGISESLSAECLSREQGTQTLEAQTASVLTNTTLTLRHLQDQERERVTFDKERETLLAQLRELERTNSRYQMLLAEKQGLCAAQEKAMMELESDKQNFVARAQRAEEENERLEESMRKLRISNAEQNIHISEIYERDAHLEEARALSVQQERERAKEAEVKALSLQWEMVVYKCDVARMEGTRNLKQLQQIARQVEDNGRALPQAVVEKAAEFQQFLQACQRTSQEATEAYRRHIAEVQGGKCLSDLPTLSFSPPPMPQPPGAAENQLSKDMARAEGRGSPFENTSETIISTTAGYSATQSQEDGATASTTASETDTAFPVFPKPQFLKGSRAPPGFKPQPSPPAKPLQRPKVTPVLSSASSHPRPLTPLSSISGSKPAGGPLSMFDRLLKVVNQAYPDIGKPELMQVVEEVKRSNGGTFSGLQFQDLSEKVMESVVSSRDAATRQSNGPTTIPDVGQRASVFSKSDSVMECSICTEEIHQDLKMLDCGHGFHIHCIKRWFKTQRTCPNCREHSLLSEDFPSLR